MNWWIRALAWLCDAVAPPRDGQAEQLAESEQRFDAERQRAFEKAQRKAQTYGDNHDGREL